MKKILNLFLLLLLSNILYGQAIPQNPNKTDQKGLRQGKWTILYDADWNVITDASQVTFYRTITYLDNKPIGKVIDWYKNGKQQMVADSLISENPDRFEGNAIYYRENGNKEKVLVYENGKVLKQTYYNLDGSIAEESSARLDEKGLALYKQGRYKEAIKIFEKSRIQTEREVGRNHQDYASSCNNLALLYTKQGLYAQAEALYLEAKGVRVKVLGKEHTDYAVSCNNLGVLYSKKGLYAKAEPLLIEAKAIRAKVLGKEHLAYATSCNNLARVYHGQSFYVKAELLYIEAKNIYQKVLGKEHPTYATSCHNLAGLYYRQGYYAKAESLFIESKKIREKALGKKHPAYAMSCDNLAELYKKQGRYAKAKVLCLEAKNIREKVLGKEHPMYATSCNNLAALYNKQNRYKEAEILYIEAKNIREKVLGKEHPRYAASCNNLAKLYHFQGFYIKAEPLYIESKNIIEKALSKEHPAYATSCNNLGELYKMQGKYKEVEALFIEARNIQAKILDKKHPEYATSCNNLSTLYWKQEKYSQSFKLWQEVLQNYQAQVQQNFASMSEKDRKLFFDEKIGYEFEIYNSFALQASEAETSLRPDLLSQMYNNRIFTKALLLNSTQKLVQSVRASGNMELIQALDAWQAQKNQVAQLYSLGIQEIKNKGIDIQAEEAKVESLEKALSQKASALGLEGLLGKSPLYTWQDIQKVLKKDEVAMELIRFRKNDGKWFYPDSLQYAALFIHAKSKYPELVLLKNGKELEEKFLNDYKVLVDTTQKKPDASLVYNAYWKPIQEKLKTLQASKSNPLTIYISLDGVYNQINLNTLKNPSTGKYLLEEIDLRVVTNTKDLVDKGKRIKTKQEDINVLFGYPNYNMSQNEFEQAKNKIIPTYASASSSNDKERASIGHFGMLLGTKEEVEGISKTLQENNESVKVLMNNQATEEKIKQLRNPKVLHIASHGFFIDTKVKKYKAKVEKGKVSFNRSGNTPPPSGSTDAMLNSGIVFAGVNDFQKATGEKPKREDGVLTAYEATTLYLDQTDLVVLSACETGLGDVQAGEGVYGLQRALKVAGTKNILMSLWKVDDDATQKLMRYFYTSWLKSGNARHAFIEAQSKIKAEYPEPYYWGAFVMIGE